MYSPTTNLSSLTTPLRFFSLSSEPWAALVHDPHTHGDLLAQDPALGLRVGGRPGGVGSRVWFERCTERASRTRVWWVQGLEQEQTFSSLHRHRSPRGPEFLSVGPRPSVHRGPSERVRAPLIESPFATFTSLVETHQSRGLDVAVVSSLVEGDTRAVPLNFCVPRESV